MGEDAAAEGEVVASADAAGGEQEGSGQDERKCAVHVREPPF